MKKILVPIDFSDCSRLAVDFASNLARKVNGEIYLLYVLETEEPDTGLGSSGSWAGAEAVSTVPYMIGRLRRVKTEMENFISENGLNTANIHDSAEVGVPYIKINEAAEKYNAEVIIMGTHGVSGMQKVLIGSVAEKVVQHANIPVLTIKERKTVNPTNIIFASDFTEEADNIFEKVRDFAAIYNAKIHLLNVADRDDENKNEKQHSLLRTFAIRHNAEDFPYHIFPAAKKEEGILLYSKEINADLIAIGTHGRSGLARFFNGSISVELVNHSFCPVLTVNFKDKSIT